jgi:hypothetical protein
MDKNQRLIIVLSATLLAALLVSILVFVLLPDQSEPTAVDTPPSPEEAFTQSEFNLGVTERTEYRRLDSRPLQEGALPVAPPAAVGKANPFL